MVTTKKTRKRNQGPVRKTTSKSLKRRPLAKLPENSEREFEVEKVEKYCEKRDRCLVKWRGFEEKTFEPIENLYNCIELVNEARKVQQLEPIAQVSQNLCGAAETCPLKLNPNDWVPVEKIRIKLEQILQKRYPKFMLKITAGYPNPT